MLANSRISRFSILTVLLLSLGQARSSLADLPLASVGSSIAKGISQYFGKEGAEQTTEYLARRGSKDLLERVATTASREGGEATVQRIAKLVAENGPETLAALDNAPHLLPLLKSLDELPAGEIKHALTRLAAGGSGRELAEAVVQHGTAALRAELKHPGVGLVLVRSLGDEGAELAANLSDDSAIAVARHAEEIAALPSAQREGVLALLHNDSVAFVRFIGRFVEANPGKTLFTAATTGVILAQPERILGGDEIVFDADGNPIVVSKSGILGRSLDVGGNAAEHISERYVRPLFFAVATFVGVFLALFACVKLWHSHRREQLQTQAMLNESKPVIDSTAQRQ